MFTQHWVGSGYVWSGCRGGCWGGAPRVGGCVRRERWDRRGFRAVRARGRWMSTFQCSLRPRPAAARWAVEPEGSVPHFYTTLGGWVRRRGQSHMFTQHWVGSGYVWSGCRGGCWGGAPRVGGCVRRERWDRRGFRAVRARGRWMSTFQCSLRPRPAAARWAGVSILLPACPSACPPCQPVPSLSPSRGWPKGGWGRQVGFHRR